MRRPLAGAGRRLRLAGALALGQAAGRGALAVALLILVRHLPVDEFGKLALALAVVQILGVVADAGFARLLVRDVARSGSRAPGLARELLAVRIRAVLIVVAAAGLAVSLLPGLGPTAFGGLAVAYLLTESVAFGFESAAVGAERPWRFVVAQVVAGAALLGGIAALADADRVTLTNAMAVLVGSSALKVCGHLAVWSVLGAPRSSREARRPALEVVREALPFLGLAVLAALYYRVGIISLFIIRGDAETASFGAVLRVVDAVGIVAGLVFAGISPAFSRAHRHRPEAVYGLWRRAVVLCAAAIVPLAMAAAFTSPAIARMLFGGDYEATSGGDLRLLLPALALMVPQALSASVVYMANDHRALLLLSVVNTTACVGLSFALSATLGSGGAALALSIAETLSFALIVLLIRRSYGPGAGLRQT